MPKISRIVSDASQAISIKYNNLVYEMRRNGRDVIVLSLGEAFFDLPFFGFDDLPFPEVYHYSHSRGTAQLRAKLAEYFFDRYAVRFDPARQIVITAGSKVAVYMAFLSILDPGDEVIIFEPYWVSYPEQIRLCHGVPVAVPLDCNVDGVERLITERTKCIVLNNPNNPRGKSSTAKELTRLLDIARKHNLYVLSDEAYSDFVYSQNDFVSLGKLDPEFRNVIVCNSISKNFGISGWRLGYVIGNQELVDNVLKVNQHIITCPATILEYYIAKHFDAISTATRPQIAQVLSRRREVEHYMNRIGLSFLPGNSTFYLFVSIEPSGLDSDKFATRLLVDKGVSVVPGIGYGASCDRYVRVSVGAESAGRTYAGLDAIRALVEETRIR